MDLLELINTRRSIREFTSQTVAREDIKKIVEAGLRAPSSKNSCPWHILVLTGKEKDEVADWALADEDNRGKSPISYATNRVPETIPEEKKDTTNASAKIIKNAAVLILIFNLAPYTGGKETFLANVNRGNIYTSVTEILGLGACMENMLLAGHALGLGAVPLADVCPAERKLKEKYGFDYDFVIGLAFGYPAYNPGKRIIKPEQHLDKFNADLVV